MAGSTSLRLMVLVLCFSYIIYLNGATPVTRTANLLQKFSVGEVPDSHRVHDMENNEEEVGNIESSRILMRRMEMELNDYPGSGANNRHTPRPQLGRGCIDC